MRAAAIAIPASVALFVGSAWWMGQQRSASLQPHSPTFNLETDVYPREAFDPDHLTDEDLADLNAVIVRLERMTVTEQPIPQEDINWLASGMVDSESKLPWEQREHILVWSSGVAGRIDETEPAVLTVVQYAQITEALLWVLINDENPDAREIAAIVAGELDLQHEPGFKQGIAQVLKDFKESE